MTITTRRGAQLEERPHYVYTLSDGDGNAVYVGMSGPYERSEGLRVERALIERLQPRGNRAYTTRDPRRWIAETSRARGGAA